MLSSASAVLITMLLRFVYIYAHCIHLYTMSLKHATCMLFNTFVILHALHNEVILRLLLGKCYKSLYMHQVEALLLLIEQRTSREQRMAI
jgi:hypothetical protein